MGAAAGAFGAFPDEPPWRSLRREIKRRRLADQLGRMSPSRQERGQRHARPGPWGGPPWAGGWPGSWGPPWAGGHRRGPGRAARGNVRLAILALLWEGPRHGYQLMQDIAERTDGAWRPSPGSVYPVLSALQDEGLVDDEKVSGRRVFTLTDAGHAYAADRAEELAAVFDDSRAEEEAPQHTDTRQLLMGVATAAIQVLTTGTPQQVEQAQRLLTRTRRELYALLAEDDEGGTDEEQT